MDRLKGKKEKESAERQNCNWSFMISLKCVARKVYKNRIFLYLREK